MEKINNVKGIGILDTKNLKEILMTAMVKVHTVNPKAAQNMNQVWAQKEILLGRDENHD